MVTSSTVQHSVDAFDDLAAAMQTHFTKMLDKFGPHLFTVDPSADLYDLYLNNLPIEWKQHHTCHTCQNFIRIYGSLVVIDDDGNVVPAILPSVGHVPELYNASVWSMRRTITGGKVTGVALITNQVCGTPITGTWTHMAITLPTTAIYRPTVLSAGQAMAKKHEDFLDLGRGLREFNRETVAQAVTLLESEALYRSEKVIGPARFLLALHDILAKHRGHSRNNLLWKAVAAAPPGFCQPRSSMVGTLLEDIGSGLNFSEVKRRFDRKMRPDKYQRPQAAPAAGTIAQAEKLVETLGIEPALHRRFARLEEIQTIWKPSPLPEKERKDGVFGHLLPKGAQSPAMPLAIPAQKITWTKFERTVLPNAKTIEVFMRPVMNFCAIVTAVHDDAPPILQWDTPEQRNPFSLYVYIQGSSPKQWQLTQGTWVPVTAVTYQPSMWFNRPLGHHRTSAILILDGAADAGTPNLVLFPEILRADLHAVRSVIEAYSHAGKLEGFEQASACGLRVGNDPLPHELRVTTVVGVATYTIDRWD